MRRYEPIMHANHWSAIPKARRDYFRRLAEEKDRVHFFQTQTQYTQYSYLVTDGWKYDHRDDGSTDVFVTRDGKFKRIDAAGHVHDVE